MFLKRFETNIITIKNISISQTLPSRNTDLYLKRLNITTKKMYILEDLLSSKSFIFEKKVKYKTKLMNFYEVNKEN